MRGPIGVIITPTMWGSILGLLILLNPQIGRGAGQPSFKGYTIRGCRWRLVLGFRGVFVLALGRPVQG